MSSHRVWLTETDSNTLQRALEAAGLCALFCTAIVGAQASLTPAATVLAQAILTAAAVSALIPPISDSVIGLSPGVPTTSFGSTMSTVTSSGEITSSSSRIGTTSSSSSSEAAFCTVPPDVPLEQDDPDGNQEVSKFRRGNDSASNELTHILERRAAAKDTWYCKLGPDPEADFSYKVTSPAYESYHRNGVGNTYGPYYTQDVYSCAPNQFSFGLEVSPTSRLGVGGLGPYYQTEHIFEFQFVSRD